MLERAARLWLEPLGDRRCLFQPCPGVSFTSPTGVDEVLALAGGGRGRRGDASAQWPNVIAKCCQLLGSSRAVGSL